VGTPGNDVICANGGNDVIIGNGGGDIIIGGPGNDVLIGGTGNDQIFGNGGNDIIAGGGGNDVQDGGTGQNVVYPGPFAPGPGAPTGVSAVSGNGWANVAWTPPANTGAGTLLGYTLTASPGGQTTMVPATATRGVVSGLTDGVAYTFTVTARTTLGLGPASAPSGATTPSASPVGFTTTWSTSENPRVLQSAAYENQTPQQLQATGVTLLAYLLALAPPMEPTPSVPPPSLAGTINYTTTWAATAQSPLLTVMNQYALTPAEAQKLGTTFLSYLLALSGH
jgi:hypothetical protein